MTTQPEALRLAELLETDGWPDAAAELRRLHEFEVSAAQHIAFQAKCIAAYEAGMRQALEALEWLTAAEPGDEPPINAAITALRERLKQPQQEPVAGYVWEEWTKEKSPWGTEEWVQTYGYFPPDTERKQVRNVRALYTAPPRREWVGLSDAEVRDEVEEYWGAKADGYYEIFARAIEARLKEKNA